MIIKTVKTERVTVKSTTIEEILDRSIHTLPERSIVVITSKIIALCEGRTVPIGDVPKEVLISREADYFLEPKTHPLGIALTITRNLLVPTAGIDESNGNGDYILWPADSHASARNIRSYLARKHNVTEIGVLITDSKTTPMRWGTSGIALSYAGFAGLNDFIGKPDLFGRPMEVTKVNVADGLAAAAVVTMGESNEQTPLAVISDIPFVHFDPDKPTKKELTEWQIPMETDLYGPLLKNAPWKKGDKKT